MEKIKVNKDQLLEILKTNREKHKKEYLEAIKAYRVKAADLLSKELNRIVSGEDFQTHFNLQKPESHEKEYDLSISMLEMSVDQNVIIDQYEFNQLVNDEWDWKRTFSSSYMSNSAYVGVSTISSSGSQGCCGTKGTQGNSGADDIEIRFPEDEL